MNNHTGSAFDEAHAALRDFVAVNPPGTGWLYKHIAILIALVIAAATSFYFLHDIARFLIFTPLLLGALGYTVFISLRYAFHWRRAYEQLEASHRRLQKAITRLSPEEREALLGPATDNALAVEQRRQIG